MKSQSINVGERILSLRLSRGMTRETLAEKADISVQFLSDIEKGRKSMTITTLCNLCDALCVTPDFILNVNTDSLLVSEISSIISTLPIEKQEYLKRIVLTFVESHNKQ